MRTLLVVFALAVTAPHAPPGDPLAEGFAAPPLAARPRALWAWINGNTDLSEITRELEEVKAKGMGGLDIWDIRPVVDNDHVVPAGPAFMSDASVAAIVHAVREATRLGLEIGLTIASGWNAGGSWTRPEFATMGLYRTTVEVSGPAAVEVTLPFPDLPDHYGEGADRGPAIIERGPDGLPVFYRDVAVLAIPVTAGAVIPSRDAVMDLTGRMAKDGRLSWTAPAGHWKIVRYVCTNTGQPMISHSASSRGPMIDHFNPEATEAHVKHFLDRLSREMGPLDRTALKYLYTDSYEVRGELWTPRMLDEFRRRAGYDLLPFMPVFEGQTVVDRDTTERFLFDYRKVLSDLIIDSHYAKGVEVCHRYGIGFVAEAAGPGQPIHNCPFESLRSSGVLDVPRGEFWHNTTGEHAALLQVVKGVASSAHIYGKRFVEAEAFTSVWLWQETPADLRPTADHAFAEGLNRVVFHTFPHTPRAAGRPGWVYSFGTQISETLPWWPMARPFVDYLARCSFMLQRGQFVGDVLYYYGDRAPNFVAPKHVDPSLGPGYDYDAVNSDVLLSRLDVRDGRFVLPDGTSYEVLALPTDEPGMNLDVLRRIEALVGAGGTILGPKPTRSLGLFDHEARDADVRRIADRLWQDCGDGRPSVPYGAGRVVCAASLRDTLAARGVLPDVEVVDGTPSSSIDFIHRRDEDNEIYFVRNTTGQPLEAVVAFRAGDRVPEVWDAVSGARARAAYDREGARTRIRLSVDPDGSLFVVFRRGAATTARAAALAAAPGTSITVPGPWRVSFPTPAGPRALDMPSLTSWSDAEDEEIRGFAGTATYAASMVVAEPDVHGRSQLRLGHVAGVAHVWVNGIDCGIAWARPWRVDASRALRAGQNDLRIEVASTWPNPLMVDAHRPAGSRRFHSNITKLPNAWTYELSSLPSAAYPLRQAGLLGPVTLNLEGAP